MARIYTKHALTPVIDTLRLRGVSAVDGRTALGRAVKAWRKDQEAHLGTRLTPPMVSILDHAEVSKLLLASIDRFLLEDASHIVNRKKRVLTPIAVQRGQLVDSHRKDMLAIGLERAAPVVPALEAYLAKTYGKPKRVRRRRNAPKKASSAGYGIRQSDQAETSALAAAPEPCAEAIAAHAAEHAAARGDAPTPGDTAAPGDAATDRRDR